MTCQISISLDGFAAGPNQSLDNPIGEGGMRLHEWVFTTAAWRRQEGQEGGEDGPDSDVAAEVSQGIGAYIMGRKMFGGGPGEWDQEWRGWWGDDPPYHTPVFVLTHHPREPLMMKGGTTFHFLDAAPADALEVARDAAAGQDVRIGGGPTMMRPFIAAGLVDYLHVVQVPILLGRGVRLWDGLEALEQQYDVEAVSTPLGVTHLTFTR